MNGIVDQILEVIPVGLGMVQSNSSLKHIKNDFLTYMEKNPPIDGYPPIDGFGTLGSGNHFISFDFDGDDVLWIVIHSGSRSFGYAVASYYIEKAQLYNKIWHSETPSSELAFIPKEDELYSKYVHDMKVALRFAEENRNNMLEKIISILSKNMTPIEIDVFLDSHHNFAAMENHFGSNVMVHRKGAIRARIDEKVVIPGNMNQGTVICIGSGNEESFTSCSHRAGRKLGRKEARRVLDLAEELKELDKRNITLFSKNDAHDEMSGAYKDFDDVMRLQEDLVTITKRLNTVGIIKG
jgi:tRNA-splicing ligase RtcB